MKQSAISFLFSLILPIFVAGALERARMSIRTVVLEIEASPRPKFAGRLINTTIPTTLHLDLLRENLIEDPFFSNNYNKLKWVSQCNISYSANITFSDQLLRYERIELVLEGVDTYSTVYFNDKQLLKTKNAFVEYRAELPKQLILPGSNILKISIQSTSLADEAGQKENKMPFAYAHTRKACYQYSWDWAPYLNTLGIWKDMYIDGYDLMAIDYVWARNRDIKEQEAIINFAISLKSTHSQLSGSNYSIEISNPGIETVTLGVDNKFMYADVNVSSPRLWWPNGIGEPYIYDFLVQLKGPNNIVVDTKRVPFGIRTVELDQSNNNFTLKINGYEIYCKGANYVPADMFYPRLSNPDYIPGNTIEKLLDDAVESHYNMIRVWGGGQYESDLFLELASRRGIMIFYDFMFSDSIYPADRDFLENVEVEVKQQVRRARNHPALVLWCGNNEVLQGIYSWQWGSSKYKEYYHHLFESLIPEILKREDPNIPYIPSSPVHGVGNSGFSKGGDVHFWGVWAGNQNFEKYKSAIGRFNSEFGTQAMPVWETVVGFTQSDQRSYESKGLLAHQRHSSKFNTLRKYIRTYAHASKDFEAEVYLSGLIQAFGVEIAIKYQRMSKPESYGTLYWQMNDAWPAISWSSIDYYGRWKPLQYMAKRLFPNVAIFAKDNKVIAVNDNLHPVSAMAIIAVQHLNGTNLIEKKLSVSLNTNEARQIISLDIKDQYQKSCIIYCEIVAGRNKEMSSTSFFGDFKDLHLEDPTLTVQYSIEYNTIMLSTNKPIKNLYISNTKTYVKLSDNYFDMIAGRTYKVTLDVSYPLAELKATMLYRSYLQIHQDQSLTLQVLE